MPDPQTMRQLADLEKRLKALEDALQAKPGGQVTLKGTTINIESAAVLTLKGAMIRLN